MKDMRHGIICCCRKPPLTVLLNFDHSCATTIILILQSLRR